MAERKPTPNIMGELLGEKPEAPKPRRPVKQQASTTVKHLTSTPVHQQASDTKPIKATYYFSPATVEAIEEAWLQLRKLDRTAGRSGISKSLIVEKAIQIALEELERKGDKSQLASMTVTQHR